MPTAGAETAAPREAIGQALEEMGQIGALPHLTIKCSGSGLPTND